MHLMYQFKYNLIDLLSLHHEIKNCANEVHAQKILNHRFSFQLHEACYAKYLIGHD